MLRERLRNLLLVLLFFALAIGMLAIPDWGFLRGEITEYPAHCKVKPTNGKCPNGSVYFTLNTTTYKPIPEQQVVLYWMNGMSPDKFTKCAVVNRKNWKCSYDDSSAEFGFNNGQYFLTELNLAPTSKPLFENRFYVSRWEYLWMQWTIS